MSRMRQTIGSFDEDLIGNEEEYVKDVFAKCPFMVFLKTDCPISLKLKQLLDHHRIEHNEMYLDIHINGPRVQAKLSERTNGKLLPYVFVEGKFIGGYQETQELVASGLLDDVVNNVDLSQMEYDLLVIGGGTSGIAAALEAAKFGKKVALCDSVQPTAHGTTWGLGGSPGGSGSVSKDVFHRSSLLRHDFRDAPFFGWETTPPETCNWEKIAKSLEEHLKAVSWVHRKTLREAGVQYINGWARFKDHHTITVTDPANHEKNVTAKVFIIATGSRHRYLEIKGEEENALTVEDVLSLSKMEATRALVIGSDRDGLEIAGILSGLNIETAVTVRKKLLRNTDRFIADRLKKFLEAQGVQFITNVTVMRLQKIGDVVRVEGKRHPAEEEQTQTWEFSSRKISELGSRKSPPPMDIKEAMSLEEGSKQFDKVDSTTKSTTQGDPNPTDPNAAPANTTSTTAAVAGDSKPQAGEKEASKPKTEESEDFLEDFQLVVVAAGRRPNVADLGLQNLDIDIDRNTCKIKVDDFDQTSVPNIFAIGQVSSSANSNVQAIAKKAAQLLSRRLFNMSTDKMNYNKVPILLLTPMEYAYIGDSEETAKRIHGKVEVYHNIITTPKSSLPNRFDNRSYVKVICAPKVPNVGSQVVGIHIMAPNAGEALQGFVPEFVRGFLTKEQLDQMVGIHPTIAEAFSDLSISKASGKEIGLNVI